MIEISIDASEKIEIIDEVLQSLDVDLFRHSLLLGVDPSDISESWPTAEYPEEQQRLVNKIVEIRDRIAELQTSRAALLG